MCLKVKTTIVESPACHGFYQVCTDKYDKVHHKLYIILYIILYNPQKRLVILTSLV